MKFSARQDIEAPAAYVYAALTDFEAWERAAMRRGAEVSRTSPTGAAQAELAWQVLFEYRGKRRNMQLKLVSMTAPSNIQFAAHSPALDASLIIEIIEMSARRSRIGVTTNVAPLTLTAKLFIQSLRLARARVDRKYFLRIAQMAGDIEQRYRAESKSA